MYIESLGTAGDAWRSAALLAERSDVELQWRAKASSTLRGYVVSAVEQLIAADSQLARLLNSTLFARG
jgi:hypothetical protein